MFKDNTEENLRKVEEKTNVYGQQHKTPKKKKEKDQCLKTIPKNTEEKKKEKGPKSKDEIKKILQMVNHIKEAKKKRQCLQTGPKKC